MSARTPARKCVHDLIARYNVSEDPKDLYHFEHTACAEASLLCWLRTALMKENSEASPDMGRQQQTRQPLPKGRLPQCLTDELPEQAACEMFKRDGEVDEVRQRLPPPMDRIRKFFNIDKHQKDELAAMGFDPKAVQSDITKAIYSGFRDLGCCTALWDM